MAGRIEMIRDALFIVCAYLLGTIPFGLLIGYSVKGIDIRQFGSRNIGATNAFRVIGKKWGILVFFLDALKGAFAVILPKILTKGDIAASSLILTGVAAIIGHSFPVWLGFRGGKGVATSLGVFLALAFMPSLITFAIWGVVFSISRILSVASLTAALLFPLVLFLGHRQAGTYSVLFPVSLCLVLFIFYTHRSNIQRLIKGDEKRLF